MAQETAWTAGEFEICPACNGAGGDNNTFACSRCDGTGGVRPRPTPGPWQIEGSIFDGFEAAITCDTAERLGNIAHVRTYADVWKRLADGMVEALKRVEAPGLTAAEQGIAALCESIRTGRPLADFLPARSPTLRELWLAAAEASEAVRAGYRDNLDEYEMDRREDARSDAEHALRDHLLTEHGLTTADLKRCVL